MKNSRHMTHNLKILTMKLNKSTHINFALRSFKIKYKTTIVIDDFMLIEAKHEKKL